MKLKQLRKFLREKRITTKETMLPLGAMHVIKLGNYSDFFCCDGKDIHRFSPSFTPSIRKIILPICTGLSSRQVGILVTYAMAKNAVAHLSVARNGEYGLGVEVK